MITGAMLAAGLALAGPMPGPVQWARDLGGNGHWYEYVAPDDTPLTWAQAVAAANARGGYLATVTSPGENVFIFQLTGGQGRLSWLGGSDEGSEGQWTWRVGPETGQAFGYTNWWQGADGGFEPNNLGGEHYLQLGWYADGQWNDTRDGNNLNGYVIESIPEPPGAALMLTGLGALALAWRRRRGLTV